MQVAEEVSDPEVEVAPSVVVSATVASVIALVPDTVNVAVVKDPVTPVPNEQDCPATAVATSPAIVIVRVQVVLDVETRLIPPVAFAAIVSVLVLAAVCDVAPIVVTDMPEHAQVPSNAAGLLEVLLPQAARAVTSRSAARGDEVMVT